MTEIKQLTLDNIAQGAAPALFAEEWQRVLDNIRDLNYDAVTTRSVTLKISVIPNKDRDTGAVMIDVTSKLAPRNGIATSIGIGKDGHGRVVCAEHQQNFDFSTQSNIADLAAEGGGE
jgi:hypothetical protein